MRICIPMIFAGTLISLACAVGMIWSQPPKGKEAEAKAIPLESCYATFGGSACQFISDGGDKPYAVDLGELFRNQRGGASNVALVRGKDIAGAVKATRRPFSAGQRADTPALPNPDRPEAEPLPLWLVAYFGTGSSVPGFGRVQTVEVRGRSVRVTYFRANANKVSADIVHFYLWARLGRAEAGSYTLELFDAVRNEVTLMRRVVVTGP